MVTAQDNKGVDGMAIAFIFEIDTMTSEQYDGLMTAMGLGQGGAVTGTVGAIAHLAGPTAEGGWRVVDVWESEDAANSFYGSDQFAPVREAAETAAMSNTPWPLHRVEVG